LANSHRLAAILAADIAGYSRLMGESEEDTVRDLNAHQAVLLPMVEDFGGRVIDTVERFEEGLAHGRPGIAGLVEQFESAAPFKKTRIARVVRIARSPVQPRQFNPSDRQTAAW
jgi:class 3 adenylate cyclase